MELNILDGVIGLSVELRITFKQNRTKLKFMKGME